ncbi:hypothetical protein J5X84_04850 [Streptosporangiaceae bacterium NEAU-GS5]|nr:hypothetical protein [Streptosporangiaceae bacterium NEAU-GS5]
MPLGRAAGPTLVAAALCLVSACGGGSGTVAATPSASVAASDDSAIRPDCLNDDERSKGDPPGPLVALMGSGPKGVVFAPQLGDDACQWIEKARELAGKGYHTATFSWGDPAQDSLPAAVARLRAEGATKIVLVGASAGGGVVLQEAGGLEGVAGVVALSPVDVYGGMPGLAAYKGPLLLVTAEDDTNPPLQMVKQYADQHPGSEQFIKIPGNAHGVVLLAGDEKLNATIDAFITGNLGP